MVEKPHQPDLIWEAGWTGHENAQLLRMAKLPFEEKLRWLEETQELILALKAPNKIQNG